MLVAIQSSIVVLHFNKPEALECACIGERILPITDTYQYTIKSNQYNPNRFIHHTASDYNKGPSREKGAVGQGPVLKDFARYGHYTVGKKG